MALTRLPRDVLTEIFKHLTVREFLVLRRASAVIYRWSVANSDRPRTAAMSCPERWEETLYVRHTLPAEGVYKPRTWQPAQTHYAASQPQWRMRAMVEQYSQSRLWMDAARVVAIARKATALMTEEPFVMPVPAPVVVIGDVHGRFEEFSHLLLLSGGPPERRLLFLGDYMDRMLGRGASIKTFVFLLLLKTRFPESVILLRGSEEHRLAGEAHAPYDECGVIFREASVRKRVWRALCAVFPTMPSAAVIGGEFFSMHGGLPSEEAKSTLVQLQGTAKQREGDFAEVHDDLQWGSAHGDDVDAYFETNMAHNRRPGCDFGHRASAAFLRKNRLGGIIRSSTYVPKCDWRHGSRVCTVYSTATGWRPTEMRASFAVVEASLDVRCVTYDYNEDVDTHANGREHTPVRKPRAERPYFL